MKFINKHYLDVTKVGTTRTTRKFLIFPRRFGNETRWLESADMVERVTECGSTHNFVSYVWREIGFADKQEHAIQLLNPPSVE